MNDIYCQTYKTYRESEMGILSGPLGSKLIYEKQTEEEALAEDEAAYEDRIRTTIDIPVELMEDDKLTLAGLVVFGKKPEEKRPKFVIKAVLFPAISRYLFLTTVLK